jgi:hypothetical protein
MTLEFQTAEDLYAHYQAVAHRIGSRRYVYPVVPVATGFQRPSAPAVVAPPQYMEGVLDAPAPVVAERVLVAPEEYWLRIEAGEVPKSEKTALRMVRLIAEKHKVTVQEILGPSRKNQIMVARQEAYWWLYKKFKFSAPRTSQIIGNRDHTCVLQGVPRHLARQPK